MVAEDRERRAEELLSLLGEEMAENRKRSMEPVEEPEREQVDVSAAAAEKARRKKWTWTGKRVCALVICMIIAGAGITTASSSAVRLKLANFFLVDKSDHTDLVQTEQSEFTILYPSYLPKGYQKTDEEDIGGSGVNLTYSNEKKDDFIYIFESEESENVALSVSIDNEHTTREKCLIGEYEGYYFISEELRVLVWERENVYYTWRSLLPV